MSPQDDDLSLIFGLSTESRFFFKCQRCSVCCSNKAIEAGPYEILRLSRNLGVTTGTFLRTYCEDDGAVLRNRPDGRCIFLVPQGCGVHPDRPLVCRLYPLGVLWDAAERSGSPTCRPTPIARAILGDEGTVAGYLASQDVSRLLTTKRSIWPSFNNDKVNSLIQETWAGVARTLLKPLSRSWLILIQLSLSSVRKEESGFPGI